MNTTACTKRWVSAYVVLMGAAAHLSAAPQTPPPAPPAAAPPAVNASPQPVPSKPVRFEFRDKRWAEVLEWLSDQTGIPVISNIKPQGTFTFISPKVNNVPREYTIPQVIDIINEALSQQKFLMIRREASFIIVPNDDPIDKALLPRVLVDDLPNRGKAEVVSTVLQINTIPADDMAPEVKKMMGPFGEVTVLTKSNQLLMQDTAGNLLRIIKTVEEVEKSESKQNESFSHTCVNIRARDADRILRDLLGDPRVIVAQIMAAAQPRRDEQGRPVAAAQPNTKLRMYYITADERTNNILVSGPADKIAQAKEIMKKIDVAQAGQKAVIPGPPVLKSYPVPANSAREVAATLLEIYSTSRVVKVTAVGTNSIMVFAPASDQMDIAEILGGAGLPGGTQVRMIPMTTQDASSVALTLKGMFVDIRTGVGPYIEGDTARNVVILKGTAEQIADIEAALKAIGESGGSANMRIIPIEKGSPAAVAAELARMLNETRGIPVNIIKSQSTQPTIPPPAAPPKPPAGPTPGSGNGGGEPQAPQISDPQKPATPAPANPNQKPVNVTIIGGKIILTSDDPQALAYAQELVRLMTTASGDGEFEVIRLKKANATDAARVIDELFNGKQQGQGGGGQQNNPFAQMQMRGFPGMMGGGGGGASSTTSKVRVVADPGSNSLLVRASPIEMVTIKNLLKTSIDAEDDVAGTQKVHPLGPFKHANATEVAQVIQSVYREYTGQESRGGNAGGFPGFFFGGAMGGGGGGRNSRPPDANGNPRTSPLSIGIDDRSNMIWVLSSDTMFKDIETLAKEIEKQAAGAVSTIKIVSLKGIDPELVREAIDALSGNRSPMNNRGGQGGQGGGNFGGGNFGGGNFGNQGMGGGNRGNFGGGGNLGGGMFGGGNQGMGGGNRGNFGGGNQGIGGGNRGGGNFGGGGGNFGGGGGNRGGGNFGGGGGNRGGGNRAGGGGPNRAPDRESRGPDFFEQGVMDDPTVSQLFDPQASGQSNVLNAAEEQQPPAQPMPPVQPVPGGQPPQAPDEFRTPRRPLGFVPLPELGTGVFTGDPSDIEELIKLIEYLQKEAAGTQAVIELVPLKFGDATSITNILAQVFQRFLFLPSGNVLVGSGTSRAPQPAGQFGAQAGAIQQPSSLLMIPLPRYNSILVAASRNRMLEVKKEIERLDIPNAPAGKAAAFPLKKASAQNVANLITQFYTQRYSTEPLTLNQIRVTFDTSSNTVFVQAGPADLAEIKDLIDRLDTAVSAAVNDLRIIKLKSALADEMANLITQAIARGVAAPAAAPGIVPAPLPGAVAAGVTTKTTSLRFFARPGLGGSIESGMLEDVHITPDLRSNSLIIAASSRTMDLIAALVNALDVPAAAQSGINIFTLKKADAVQTATLLQQMFGGAAARTGAAAVPGFAPGGAQAAPGGGRQLITLAGQAAEGASLIELRISVDDRSNSIIVAGSRNDLDVIEAIIARLEDSNIESRRNEVVRLKNAAAADVATALQTFVTNSMTVLNQGGALTSFQEIQRNVVVVPEAISNSLLISATPRYFAEMMMLIDRLDAMPPQVVIQVLIAEVTLNDNQEFGVELGLQTPVLFNRGILPGAVPSAVNPSAIPGFNFNSTAPLPNSSLVNPPQIGYQGISNLGVGRISPTSGIGGLVFSAQSNTFNLLIRALKTQGRLDVLSRPQVMTLDNQTAAVNVGQDFPIIANTTITATGLATTDVERRNIGILLRVTPRITPDGKVLMRVFPEVSSVGQTVQLSTNVISQAFNIQQVETTVVGQDGETIVLGGLISQRDQKFENKVPCLGDLPYIGSEFRYRTQVRTKTELLVILTPHIVRSQADADRILCEEAKRMDWMLSDVAKVHASPGLNAVVPTPALPSTVPTFVPGQVTPVPDGAVMPGGPIPVNPPLPSGPVPMALPIPQSISPSAASADNGPSLIPASHQTPPEKPQGKDSRSWKIFRKD